MNPTMTTAATDGDRRSSAPAPARDSGPPSARGAAERGAVPPSAAGWFPEAWEYQVDLWQRSVLFLDVLRRRGNTMLEHERAGLPPVLGFGYETVLDARAFERPASYALLRISPAPGPRPDETKRPVIILDPRAGHGPGIGGFRRDSEVGLALDRGHPVYFVSFFPEPCPGQTLADVLHALRRFVEEVGARHSTAGPPLLYGNCQAGWAVTLLSADCAGLAGPAVLNGSPLSYWAGEPGLNTMRVLGGLAGGAWLPHWLADLGNGTFDGAWLVQNFELLNPANAVWDKYAALLASVDGERERFMAFERWWSGFFGFSRDEIVSIVENLFIGDKLERAEMRLCPGCVVDLRRIRNPLLIFASHGDLITPPHQALNWIPTVYESTDALKRAGQRIVYLLHPDVGHLGLFVSARVARLEHRAILDHVDALEALAPGLYEMKIRAPGDGGALTPLDSVVFEERRVEDVRFEYPREAFERVRRVSELNEAWYRACVSPWVRAVSSPWSAALLRSLHPMRASRYLWADRVNPWMAGIAALAAAVRRHRRPAAPDNPFLGMEREAERTVSRALDAVRTLRDEAYEAAFEGIYG